MKKQNFVKITKGHVFITIHFETLKNLSFSSIEKNHKNLSLLESDIGGLSQTSGVRIIWIGFLERGKNFCLIIKVKFGSGIRSVVLSLL